MAPPARQLSSRAPRRWAPLATQLEGPSRHGCGRPHSWRPRPSHPLVAALPTRPHHASAAPPPARRPQVRIWKTRRSQADIIRHMRWASGLEGHADLVAYWKFNDPDGDNGEPRAHAVGGGRARRRGPRARPPAGGVRVGPLSAMLMTVCPPV